MNDIMQDVNTCRKCGGGGRHLYPNTATFMGGWGGSAMTEDICDKCWGSGDDEKPGPNLRRIMLKFRDDEDIMGLLKEVGRLRQFLVDAIGIIDQETDEPYTARLSYAGTRPEDLRLLYRAGVSE